MFNPKIEEALNKQVALEAMASAKYLAMASWCDKEGLEGSARFFYRQSDEERMHMLKLVHYINESGGHAIISGMDSPEVNFESIQQLFQKVYEHEQGVTASIHAIVRLSHAEFDYNTIDFLQWYVTEQREEEALMRNILDRISLIGDGPQNLFYIDKEVDRINLAKDKEAAAAPKKA